MTNFSGNKKQPVNEFNYEKFENCMKKRDFSSMGGPRPPDRPPPRFFLFEENRGPKKSFFFNFGA